MPRPGSSARFFIAALAGLIGSAGIVVGLREAGRRVDRRAALLLVSGWALSYGVVHALFYLAGELFGVANAEELDLQLLFFAFFGEPLPLLTPVRLVDVLPAALGRPDRRPGASRAPGSGGPDRPRLGPRRAPERAEHDGTRDRAWSGTSSAASCTVRDGSGPAAGVLAGIIHGLVGGGLTLRALRRRVTGPWNNQTDARRHRVLTSTVRIEDSRGAHWSRGD